MLAVGLGGRPHAMANHKLRCAVLQVKASQMRLEQKYDLAQKTAVSDGLLLACSGSSLALGAL